MLELLLAGLLLRGACILLVVEATKVRHLEEVEAVQRLLDLVDVDRKRGLGQRLRLKGLGILGEDLIEHLGLRVWLEEVVLAILLPSLLNLLDLLSLALV